MTRYIFIFIITFTFGFGESKKEDILSLIIKEEKNYNTILKNIKTTQSNIETNKKELTKSKKSLDQLSKEAINLNETKQSLESEIVKLISKKYAITTAVKQEYKTTEKNAINRELFKVILKNAKNKISGLNNKYTEISSQINQNKEKTLGLYTLIDELQVKKAKYEKQKKQQKIYLAALKKKREEQSKTLKNKTAQKKSTKKDKKTIAPLKSYKVNKPFGTYFDKEQNMEIFNEALYLEAKRRNAKVYNVLDGRIVYVKKNSNILGNVVIVKNKNNIYTIYAHLNRIFKSIKSGKNIKAGKAIGRVSKILKFKVTKNTTYIDPMTIIKR